MRVYRMHRAARKPGDYTGSMLAGGRWNPIGTPMLYTAEHLSLSCLEILVHLDKNQLPQDYVWSSTDLPETPAVLQFHHLNSITSCQIAGDEWIRAADQAALLVPSVVIPAEFNILLNPKHTLYASLSWSAPRPFRFDPRLFVVEPLPL